MKNIMVYAGLDMAFVGLTEDFRGIILADRIVWTFPRIKAAGSGAHFSIAETSNLLPYPPKEVAPITWEYPDLTDQFPETVQQAFNREQDYHRDLTLERHLQHFPADAAISREEFEVALNQIRQKTLATFSKSEPARRAVWLKHGTGQLAARYGYQGFGRFLLLQQMLVRSGHTEEQATAIVRALRFVVRYEDPAKTEIFLSGVLEQAGGRPSRSSQNVEMVAIHDLLAKVQTTACTVKAATESILATQVQHTMALDGQAVGQSAIGNVVESIRAGQVDIAAKIEAVAASNLELRLAKAKLEQMRAEGLFAFVNRVDNESFKILCAILAHGDVAKASRAIGMKDSTIRTRMTDWKTRGPAFKVLLEFVRWRKTIGRREKVDLPLELLAGQAPAVDALGILSDVLDALMSLTPENWEQRCEELAELIRPYVPR
jgi:hypothetical protein